MQKLFLKNLRLVLLKHYVKFAPKFTKNLVAIVSVVLASGCWLSDVDRKDQKDGAKLSGIDRSREITIERVAQRSTVYLSFYTTELSYCKVEYWSKYLGDNPDQTNKTIFDCNYLGPTDRHLLRIDNLLNSDPNFYKILASTNKDVSSADVMVVEETSDNFSFFPPSGYDKLNALPKVATVIRAVLPLGQGKVHSQNASDSKIKEETSKFLNYQEGCQTGIKRSHVPFLPPNITGLETVASSSFIASKSRLAENRFGTLVLDFGGKSAAKSTWDFDVSLDGVSSKVSTEAPSEFKFVKLRSTGENTETAIGRPNLTIDPGKVEINAASDIIIVWDRSFKTENPDASIQVIIGKNSLGRSIKCTFSARQDSAIVEASVLARLPNGTYDFLVTLNSKKVLPAGDTNVVFIHAQDWRHKLIQISGSSI